MTTMDSDSESQDSDEGRRFRFEATRKDSLAGLHSRKRRSSPARTDTRRRSRSVDRGNRDRRGNVERARHDHNKQSRGSLDTRRPSRDSDAKHSKDASDSARVGSRHKDSKDSKDGKDSKNPSNSSSNHKGSKLPRESSLKISRKDSRTRERDRRRSGERSSDRCFDEKQQDKHANKSSVRSKRHSRDRSRERSHQGNRPKIAADISRSRDSEPSKTESARKIARRESEAKSAKDARRNVETATAAAATNVNSESDANSRASSPSARTDCKDLNLSDFDIVSDIDESSPENSSSRQMTKLSTRRRAENSLPHESDSGIKRRVSKQQYERLLKRQAVKNRRSLEELHKVKAENGDHHAAGTSNNNRSALSDSPLGARAPTTVGAPAASLTDDANARRKAETSKRNDKEGNQSDSDNSRSNSSTYGPILPPKVSGTSGSRRVEGKNDGEAARAKEKEKIAPPRVIGPIIPAHLRQSVEAGEIDAEDTFGPALPPHLERNKSVDRDCEDEAAGSPVGAGKVSKSEEESAGANREASEGEDDDMMGPLPSDHPSLENDLVQRQLELRARRLKAELAVCDNEDEKKREEWMIELPAPQTVSLGLAPRKFRVRPAPDMSDRSSWTDTPADKARKRMEKLENRNVTDEPRISHKRDTSDVCSETEKSRKRQKSLVEIHQKKLQKKKKKEEKEAKRIGKTAERRPFDRDVDLQANRFDEARKKSMFMKSRELDDRFSRGKI